MTTNKKILIILIFIGIIFFPFPTLAKSEIGDTCTATGTNDDCEIGADLDCEESNNPPGKTICTCYMEVQLMEEIGAVLTTYLHYLTIYTIAKVQRA